MDHTEHNQNNSQNTYLFKREEKEKAQKIQARKKVLRKVKTYFVVALVVAGAGFLLYLGLKAQAPRDKDYSVEYPIIGKEHIQDHSVYSGYNSNPPSSGPHRETPAKEGFYDTPLADEQVVHNLEHGDIWIAYHPRVSEEVVSRIKEFAGGKVIVTPREANETDLALVAWGRVDVFNLEEGMNVEKERISDFIKRYVNKGPEVVPVSNTR